MDPIAPRPQAARRTQRHLRLPEEALEQLDSLIATYDRLRLDEPVPRPGCDAEVKGVKAKIADPQATLWWTDLVQVEMCILDVTDDDALRARLLGWRARLHDVIGDAKFAIYLANAPNLSDNPTPSALRADLGECIRTVYYFYSAYGISARSRTRASVSAIRTAGFILLIEGFVALILPLLARAQIAWLKIPDSALLPIEFALATSAAAVLGSVVSVQRRVQNPSADADPFYRYIQTTADWVGLAVVPPLFGAIFGLVMYELLVSNVLLGSLITFQGTSTSNPGLQGVPAAAKDVALLLLLGFIAGFAEQLVPDALNRLAATALSSVGSSSGATPPPGSGAPGAPPAKKPTVTGLNPTSGPPGTSVIVTGTGFSGPNLAVKFGTAAAQNPKADGDTKLTVSSPAGSGTVDVTVKTDAGTSDTTSATKYAYPSL